MTEKAGPERERAAQREAPDHSNSAPSAHHPLSAPGLAALQRQAGNRAVSSVLGARRPASRESAVQRAADGSQAAINSRAGTVADNARKLAADHEGEQPPSVDPGAKASARAQQQGNFAQPDKVSAPRAQVRSAAAETKSAVVTPAEPLVGAKSSEQPGGAEHGPAAEAAAALAAGQAQAEAAQAQAAALPAPAAPPELAQPEVVDPMDSTGAPLPVSPAGDVAAGVVATRLAQLRHDAHALAVDATDHRARALGLRAAVAEARGKIDEAAGSIGAVKGHVAHRRTVNDQATAALDTSKQKAATVAAEAPGIAGKAEDGRQRTAPMATESADLAGTAGGAVPDDAEAAGKAQQQTGQIRQVSGNLATIDSAVDQTGARARQLQAEAEQAKTRNAASESTITSTRERLSATDAKLGELTAMNDAARGRVEGLAGQPDEIEAGAATQQEHADSVQAHTIALEGRLHAAQNTYRTELAGLPGPPPQRGRRLRAAYEAGPGLVAQRQVEPGERERFPSFDEAAAVISGDQQSAQQRSTAAAAAQRRQQEELAAIDAACGGDFARLSAADKAGLALRLTFSRTFSSLGETNWPKFGLGILRGFVDPRVSLAGIVQGLGTILTGAANLTSAEQWRRDPLGNLLKSSADIATGVTVVLGSIAGLAIAIIAISAALILVSWGTLAPVLLPVISVCSTVAGTVGPWAITAAEIALALNALVFIKNLVDAATASTAADLQRESMAMGEDVNAMGMMAMQIVGDKIGKAVGPRIGGALKGVQGRLAGSGNAAGVMLANNMTKIGSAMARGQARADAWAGREVPTAAGARPDSPAAVTADAPAPAATPEPAAAPAVTSEPAAPPTAAPEHVAPAGPVDAPAPPTAENLPSSPAPANDNAVPGPANDNALPAAANDNALPAAANDNAIPPSGPVELTELPPELQGAQPANDIGPLGPEANEQVWKATGTGDSVPFEQPVVEGGATDPNAPRAMGGNSGGTGRSGPGRRVGGTVTEIRPSEGGVRGSSQAEPATGARETGPTTGPETRATVPEHPVGDMVRRSEAYLRDHGIDPHSLKQGQVDGPISHYDIYEDRNGNLWAQRKRGQFGSGTESASYLGNTAEFEAPRGPSSQAEPEVGMDEPDPHSEPPVSQQHPPPSDAVIEQEVLADLEGRPNTDFMESWDLTSIEGPQAMSSNLDPQLGPNQQRYYAHFKETFTGLDRHVSVNYDPDTGRYGTIKFSSEDPSQGGRGGGRRR